MYEKMYNELYTDDGRIIKLKPNTYLEIPYNIRRVIINAVESPKLVIEFNAYSMSEPLIIEFKNLKHADDSLKIENLGNVCGKVELVNLKHFCSFEFINVNVNLDINNTICIDKFIARNSVINISNNDRIKYFCKLVYFDVDPNTQINMLKDGIYYLGVKHYDKQLSVLKNTDNLEDIGHIYVGNKCFLMERSYVKLMSTEFSEKNKIKLSEFNLFGKSLIHKKDNFKYYCKTFNGNIIVTEIFKHPILNKVHFTYLDKLTNKFVSKCIYNTNPQILNQLFDDFEVNFDLKPIIDRIYEYSSNSELINFIGDNVHVVNEHINRKTTDMYGDNTISLMGTKDVAQLFEILPLHYNAIILHNGIFYINHDSQVYFDEFCTLKSFRVSGNVERLTVNKYLIKTPEFIEENNSKIFLRNGVVKCIPIIKKF